MLVNLLLDLIFGIFKLLTLPISIPSMPEGVKDALASFLEYIAMGISILGNFFDMSYILILFGVMVAVDAGILIYKFVMFILRKIPMLNVS